MSKRKLSYYQSPAWMKKIRSPKGVSKNAGMKSPVRKADLRDIAAIRIFKKNNGQIRRSAAFHFGQRIGISARQVYKIAAGQAWKTNASLSK